MVNNNEKTHKLNKTMITKIHTEQNGDKSQSKYIQAEKSVTKSAKS